MSERDTRLLLEDIITSINYTQQFIENHDLQSFQADRKTLDATIRNLEIIGEAAKLLPDNFKQQFPNIAWRQIIGLRNVVIHKYFRVDTEILWHIVTTDLPGFKMQMETALTQLTEHINDHQLGEQNEP